MGKITDMLHGRFDGSDEKMSASVAVFDAAMCSLAESMPERHAELVSALHVALYGKHFDESTARATVGDMMHTDRHGVEQIGEHYTVEFAEQVRTKHLPDAVLWDVYVALNATWHDFEALYSDWFSAVSDTHFAKTAIAFWFDDEDYKKCSEKVWNYFN